MTKLFNYDPYFDDFDEDKNFMRVLFRPGYSLQARELTQLQTILSNQIERFGNHIFKSGSPVIGGKVSLDDNAFYIILNTQYSGSDIILENFLDKTIVSYNSNKIVRAKVIAIDDTTTNKILIVKYLSGEFFAEDDELKIYGQNIFAQVASSSAVGRSYVASIQDGVYYFKGQFVKVTPQFLVLETFYRIGHNNSTVNLQPSYKIGIEFEDLVIDEIDDISLLDPAQGSFNYQAPGATRYKVNTTLSKRTLDSADESAFIEIVRIVNGVKTREIDYPIYSEIEKTLARRTYDESGNYTVDPFVISLEEDYVDTANNDYVDPAYFTAVLDPGKAYVGGHEVQTIAPTKLQVSRARVTANVNEYDLPTNYSSYIVANTVSGTLSISDFPVLDIHCVPYSSVSRASTSEYNSSKIGTVRANMMKYYTAADANYGPGHKFTINLFELDSTSITGTLASSGSTNTVITLPSSFAQLSANGYANLYFRVTDGLGSTLAPIVISESDGSAKTITLSSALPFTPQSNTFSIDSDFKNAESLTIRNGTALPFGANIDPLSKDENGNSFITEPNRQGLIFDVPYQAIKKSSITNFDFFARKVYSDKVSDGSGVITIQAEGTDTFSFAGTAGTLSDLVVLDNINCFLRYNTATDAGTGLTANAVVSLANSNFTVTAVNSSKLEIDFGIAGVRADFIITTKVNNAEDGNDGAIRSKRMYPLYDGHDAIAYTVDTSTGLSSSNTGTVTPITGGYVFPDIGVTYFDNESAGAVGKVRDLKTPGVAVSLQVPDVYEIVKIIDSKTTTGNITTSMLTSDAHDVTDRYEFDNGQRNTHYDHATIKLKRGYSSPTGGSIYVMYKYLRHSSAPSPQNIGLFTVDSYLGDDSNVTYDNISKYLNKIDGKLMSGRSSFDYRPTRAIAGDSLSGAVCPDPDLTAEVSFQHYLNRIDRVVVKPSKEIVVVEGQSSLTPTPPPVQNGDMLIYTLFIPPYTESVKEVRADFHNNRRFTMKDIGNFEDRIKGLEYYVSLNALEKNANDSKIIDANGFERSKYGILVDNFTSRDAQATYNDVGWDNRNLIEDGELKPASLMRTFKLNWIEDASSGDYKINGTGTKKALTLDFTSEKFASQPYVTKSMSVASALYGSFNGNMKLYPEYTSDQDTGVTAKVTMNSVQGLDTAFNFVNEAFQFISDQNPSWVNDADNPFAKIVDSKWFKTTQTVSNQTVDLGGAWGNLQTTTDRTYISQGAQLSQKQITTSSSQVDLGTFVTDVGINPYLKPAPIVYVSTLLRPRTRFYAFFDGTPVDNFTVTGNKVALTQSSMRYKAGEIGIISDSTVNLATAVGHYVNQTGAYNMVYITETEDTANVRIVNLSSESLAGKYIEGMDSRYTTIISSVIEHQSGLTRAVGSSTITLAADAPSTDISGKTITLVRTDDSFDGYGKQYTISSYDTSTKVATISGTTTTAERTQGTYVYSLGYGSSNKNGDIGGVFYPPKAVFRSGERKLRLTESFNDTYDTDAISFAEKTYVSSGVTVSKTTLVDTVYNVDASVQSIGTATSPILTNTNINSRITRTWGKDPLAQTFYVDDTVYPSGLYLESVNLFFKQVDDELPIRLEIRPTVNGAPDTSYAYPESIVIKKPHEVNVSETPSVDDDTTKTNFQFSTPVFLKPGLYAVVLICDTPDYVLWTAEKGQVTLNNQLVSTNPYIGTLYKSQNTMEYVPYLNEDMAFELNRCKFVTNSTAVFSMQSEKLTTQTNMDIFRVLENSLTGLSDSPLNVNYSFISRLPSGAKETVYRNMKPGIKYNFGDDTQYAVGSRRKILQNQGDFTMAISMSTTDDTVSPLISLESLQLNAWENFIDNGELNSEDFNIIKAGAGYSNSNVITVTSSTGSGALIYLATDGVNGNVLSINVQSTGVGYTDNFTISYPDTTDASANITSNTTIVLNSEYDSTGGPCLARYITKPIVLADGFDAGDLRVFLGSNEPSGTKVEVFYKILSGSDITDFKERPYQKMECFNPTVSPSTNKNEFREYEFRPSLTQDYVTYTSDAGVVYDSFNTFSIKVLMTSEDPAVVPRVKDLRIIALPAG